MHQHTYIIIDMQTGNGTAERNTFIWLSVKKDGRNFNQLNAYTFYNFAALW